MRYETGLPFLHSTQAAAVPNATSRAPSSTGMLSLPLVHFQSANLSNVPLMTRSFASTAASFHPSSLGGGAGVCFLARVVMGILLHVPELSRRLSPRECAERLSPFAQDD